MAQIFLNDVDDAVAEIQWAREQGLFGGILLPGVPPGLGPPAADRARVRPDLGGVPGPRHARQQPLGRGRSQAGSLQGVDGDVHGRARLVLAPRVLADGARRRVRRAIPGLKLVLTEQSAGWVPAVLKMLDHQYSRFCDPGTAESHFGGELVKEVTEPPSYYWAHNCYAGASFLRPSRDPAAPRDRRRPDHVGPGLPAHRGHVPVHHRGAAQHVRRPAGRRGRADGGPHRGRRVRLRPRRARAGRRAGRPDASTRWRSRSTRSPPTPARSRSRARTSSRGERELPRRLVGRARGPAAGAVPPVHGPAAPGALRRIPRRRSPTMQGMAEAGRNNAQKQFREKFLAKTGDGGIRASWDSELRLKELDGDGIAGEVIFPDADVLGIGGVTSSPFGTGLAASGKDDPELAMAGARAHNRWLADLCSQAPDRRAGVATVPIIHDPEARVAEIRRAHASGVWGAVMIPSQWAPYPSYNDPVYDQVWATCQELRMAVTVHSGGSPRDISAGPGRAADLLHRGVVLRRPGAVVADLGRRVRALPRPAVHRHRGRRVVGARHAGRGWTTSGPGFHSTLKFGDTFREALPEPPSTYFRRNCFLGAGHHRARDGQPRTRSASTSSSGATTSRIPRARGRTRATGCASGSTTCRRTRRAGCWGSTRCARTPSTRRSCAPIADRIGPSPAEIHEQPAPPNPDEVAGVGPAVAVRWSRSCRSTAST